MNRRRFLGLVFAAPIALAAAPVRATSEHDYASGEYAIIRDGLSPDKLMSLAAHGDGEGGHEKFHVWLMAEPAHRRIMPLDDINSHNNLDTAADAYHGQWSADSRHVAVGFRFDRHQVQLNVYTIENHRAYLVAGPSLFKEVTSRNIGTNDDVRRSIPEIEWTGSQRFVLRENHLFKTADSGFVSMLGRFGKVTDKPDGQMMVEFAAEADCVLLPGHRYRVVDLRVGKFVEASQ
ncbi:MAG TPA: hypothetical protein VGD75_00720 [Bradyrhizobium sp.]